MISIEEVKKLAALARIKVSEEEALNFSKDMGNILSYVDSVKGVKGKEGKEDYLKNVLREDGNVRESGTYTEEILKNAPDTQNNYFVVRKIIGEKDRNG